MFLNPRRGRLVDLWEQLVAPESGSCKVVPVGRGHAGKTNLINAIPRVLDTLPSGIRLGYNDLLTLNQALVRVRQTEQDLIRGGLPPTLERSYRSVGLFHSESRVATLELSDEIGQPITNTTPDSPQEQQERLEEYVGASNSADVLWVMTPLPLSDSTRSLALFREDLSRYQCWLSDSIGQRSERDPVSIAFVVPKIDALFPSSAEAKTQLTETWLVDQTLKPLVDVARVGIARKKLRHCAIIPVSAFGFGNGRRVERDCIGSVAYEDLEEEFSLVPDGGLAPFNVLTLLVWSFLAAASVHGRHAQVARALRADLQKTSEIYIPIQ